MREVIKKAKTVSAKKPKAYEMFSGLSWGAQELIATFGPIAEPTFDKDGSNTQDCDLFLYVMQVVESMRCTAAFGGLDKALHHCVVESLKTGDAFVFRKLADVIEAVHSGLEQKVYNKNALAMIRVVKKKKKYFQDPEMPVLWEEGEIPTIEKFYNKSIGKLSKEPAVRDSQKRVVRRLKSLLRVPLSADIPGPKKKKK